MRTVYRYDLDIFDTPDGYFVLEMPLGAVPLHVAEQQRAPHFPSLWALVDTERPVVKRRFMITGTGTTRPEPPGSKSEYVGTFQIHGYVWHIWEAPLLVEEKEAA